MLRILLKKRGNKNMATDKYMQEIFDRIDDGKEIILNAERSVWKTPELGFREWKTHAFLKGEYEKLGYKVNEFKDIPGFYVDIETGRKGPKIAVFGELDAICVPSHKDSDKVTGAVHACGHNGQSAALLGVAIALTDKTALSRLSGSVRLIAVPAEEVQAADFIEEMKKKGILHAANGKTELMKRGYLDDVDMAFMIHVGGKGFSNNLGWCGSIDKRFTFKGKAVHVASPFNGNNALYAATSAITAVNNLRETFSVKNLMRFSSVILEGGAAVNQIPDKIVVQAMVRALTFESLVKLNDKVNRAFAAAAASMGCRLEIEDTFGCHPRIDNVELINAFYDTAKEIFPEDLLSRDTPAGAGITDFGAVSAIMPCAHPFIGGAEGANHTSEFKIADPYMLCVNSAKVQAGTIYLLLKDDAARAKEIIKNNVPPFKSAKEYFAATEKYSFNGEAVIYNEDETVTLKYKN